MEVASLVLAVVPLLIAAAENYEVTFQPFVTYCRYAKEIERFTGKLQAQHTLFYNECQLLLLEVDQDLSQILGSPNHPSRNNQELSHRLKDLMGSSHEACISTLKLINQTLADISTETAGFKDLLDPKKSKQKGKMSIFRQKLKISFSKTRLNDIVDELRNYNSDLHRLSSQIQKLRANAIQDPVKANIAVLSHLKLTQQASKRLYDVLASKWLCEDRVKHTASMNIRVDERCHDSTSRLSFNLGISCWKPPSRPPPLWLSFESTPTESSIAQSTELEDLLEKSAGAIAGTSKVRFAPQTSLSSTAASQTPHPLLDGKLCHYFQQMPKPPGDPCLGQLAKTKTFTHLVYQTPALQISNRCESLSLKDVLYSTSLRKMQQDWIAKLKLARLLAIAVLQFHATSWLPECWSSEDVYFFNKEMPIPESPPLHLPYLNAQLSDRVTDTQTSKSSDQSLATNKELHSLGVVLLELANDTPFEILSQAVDLPSNTSPQIRDFLAARRLADKVSQKFNVRYAAIVEKCLNCNFGVATKLREVELQSAVLVHVVHQLDVCLDQYRKFNSLAPIV